MPMRPPIACELRAIHYTGRAHLTQQHSLTVKEGRRLSPGGNADVVDPVLF
jgi:hypothetical protein